MKEQWGRPPPANAAFVWQREDVLDVSTRPYDPRRPQVCRDDASKELLAATRTPPPLAPGHPARADYEYKREGTAPLFMGCEPLRGWRHVTVTERRTKGDWAHCVRALVDVSYPDAPCIVLVQDNRTTHTPASLYEAFPPAEAKRIAERLAIHATPQHGSWLSMAQIDRSVLGRQCLDQRIAERQTLVAALAAWEDRRTTAAPTVDGRFTTAAARITLTHLYPSIQE